MRMTALVLFILAGASGWASADKPDPIGNQIEQLDWTVPAKKIRRVFILPIDKAVEGVTCLSSTLTARCTPSQLRPVLRRRSSSQTVKRWVIPGSARGSG